MLHTVNFKLCLNGYLQLFHDSKQQYNKFKSYNLDLLHQKTCHILYVTQEIN